MVNAITLQSCITTANALKTDLNTVSIDLAVKRISMAELIAAASKVKPGITFEVWSVNNSSDYKALLPYLSGITSDRLCLADIL
jgi:uncharacterized membrane protein